MIALLPDRIAFASRLALLSRCVHIASASLPHRFRITLLSPSHRFRFTFTSFSHRIRTFFRIAFALSLNCFQLRTVLFLFKLLLFKLLTLLLTLLSISHSISQFHISFQESYQTS
jgi:hypothetical protein